MENFNQENDNTKAITSLDEKRPANVTYEEYMKVVRENEKLKDTIVKLALELK